MESRSRHCIPGGATTGIGSLPHHNIDAALEFAFSFDIPFLPQIPIRNPWEYSVPQGLEGLPGIQVEADGSAFLDTAVWLGRAKIFDEKLAGAFDEADKPLAFEAFEPGPATSSSWQPFLWELHERGTKIAKIQTVGPLTAQWSLRAVGGARLDLNGEVSQQIFRLLLARSLGMVRRLQSMGVTALLFLDEPALFVLRMDNPRHLVGLQELKLMIQTLRKEGAFVGVHCCSDMQWGALLGTVPDFISLDTQLSLPSVLAVGEPLTQFLEGGGRLALGVVPTSANTNLKELTPSGVRPPVQRAMEQALGRAAAEKILSQALWTPACGLALHTPRDAQTVLSLLKIRV